MAAHKLPMLCQLRAKFVTRALSARGTTPGAPGEGEG
jgi:hypothetical protein